MVDLSEYSSEKLMQANERELKVLLDRYKQQHLPLSKFGIFVGYHAFALVGMYFYGSRLRGGRVLPSLKNRHNLNLYNLCITGVKHSFIMISIYAAGLAAVCHDRISLPLIRKLTQIQTTYDSFGLRFDPNYQEYLLFARMRKFDISQELIDQIRVELNQQRDELIEADGLLPSTINKIKQVEVIYQTREKEVR